MLVVTVTSRLAGLLPPVVSVLLTDPNALQPSAASTSPGILPQIPARLKKSQVKMRKGSFCLLAAALEEEKLRPLPFHPFSRSNPGGETMIVGMWNSKEVECSWNVLKASGFVLTPPPHQPPCSGHPLLTPPPSEPVSQPPGPSQTGWRCLCPLFPGFSSQLPPPPPPQLL